MTSEILNLYPHSFELQIGFKRNCDTQKREEFWDALTCWLEPRNAFLGVKNDFAVVLCPCKAPRLSSQLAKWIVRQPAIADSQILHVQQRGTSPTSTRHIAWLDAVCNMHQHHAEQMDLAIQAAKF